ncbi:MAG: DUF3078 domain-containing protein [Crocinitomicaceae bacterium]|nr:DUF3078 domain-containing protein [Crocinitomicaceae bacterium]
MKLVAVIGLAMLWQLNGFAQVTDKEADLKGIQIDTLDGWKKGGFVALNISQVGLTNWAGGGQSSIALSGIVSLYGNLKRGNSAWDNSLDLGYGILRQGSGIGLKNGVFLKTDDKIDIVSKYGRRASEKWFYAGLINFNTQSTPGFNYPNDSIAISRFLAPAYLLGAIGMDYKPNDAFTAFLSPFTMKATFVNDDSLAYVGAYGVEKATFDDLGNIIDPGKKFRMEYGGYVRLSYKKSFMENITLTTKLSLFSNYANNPQNIDVNWETLLELKVNKFISATISTHLLYDDDISITDSKGKVGPRTQFKEVIGVGFAYKW